ncbi:NTF2- export protein 2 [Rhizophlyctis rosea]|uniref:NTF2-related export protein n=1 Tax=Rhizophlyctis rosea TaxID=64517 RepID=A0AAD5S7J2_9FUNG|nr:NTF2- export protein 2 [Rhizophlyctis rosea]
MGDVAQLIDVTSRAAENFVATYYKMFDRQRHVLPQMYKDTSAIVWNGNALSGVEQYQQFCLKLPVTDHDVQSVDGQPVVPPGTTDPTRSQILVTVTGNVRYGDERDVKPFQQTFVLCPDPDPSRKGTYFVGSDIFRFI